MKTNVLFSLLVICVLSFFSCGPEYYKTAAYENYAEAHQTIAVLPSQTITSGRVPKEWTPEMVAQLEENESRAFQIAVFDEIAQRSGNRGGEIQVNLQHYTETNAKLAEAGIDYKESWTMSPTKLAAALGVDAVVRTSVQKDMFLTELESFGLSAAFWVLGDVGGWLGFLPNKTSDVFLSAAVLDAENSVAVWSTDTTRQTNWNIQHTDIVRNLARVMARRFPYRV